MSWDGWWAMAQGKIREQLLADMLAAGCDLHDVETAATMSIIHDACMAAFINGGASALKYKLRLDGEPGPVLN